MRRVSFMALAAAASLMAVAFSGGARAASTSSDAQTAAVTDGAFAEVSVEGGSARQFVVVADGLSVVASGTLSTTGLATVIVPAGVTGEYQVMVELGDGGWSTAVVDPFHGFAWDW